MQDTDESSLPRPLADADTPVPDESAAQASRESVPKFYQRTGWQFGGMAFYVAASRVYLLIALFPLAQYVYSGYAVPKWPKDFPTVVLAWAAFVALAYPVCAWQETRVFETWVRELPEQERKSERSYFTLQTTLAKNFWAAVLATYTVAGLVGIALK